MSDNKLFGIYKGSRASSLLSLLFIFAIAGMQSCMAGTEEIWTGVVDDPSQGAILAELSIDSGKYRLHYGEPRNCWLKGEEVFVDDAKIILRFSDDNGGICDDLYQGTMTIDKHDQQSWTAIVEKKSIDFAEEFTLKKK